MNRRWQTLLRPHGAAPAPVPRAREVLCAWALGLIWTLGCLWLAAASRPAALPILLLAGVVVVWGWAYMTWITWFPAVLAIAAVAQPFVPFEFRAGPEPVGITGTMAIAVLVIGVVRAVAFRRRLFPPTSLDRALLALALLLTLAAIPQAMRGPALHELKLAFVGIVTFYACTAVASIPGGALRLWPVFPLVLAAISIAAGLDAAGLITRQDSELGRTAMLQSLLLALPAAAGLALDAGRRSARTAWRLLLVVGLVGAAALATRGFGPHDLESPFRLGAPIGFGRAVVVWGMLFGMGGLAMSQRGARPLERARWTGLALTFAAAVALELLGRPISTLPQVIVLGTGAGITTGIARAAARRASATAGHIAAAAPADPGPALEEAA